MFIFLSIAHCIHRIINNCPDNRCAKHEPGKGWNACHTRTKCHRYTHRKGNTQKQAIETLVNLPEENPFKSNLLEILANWRQNLALRDNLTTAEEETIMNLSPAYLKQREEWKQEGKQEMIENLLRCRFEELDAEITDIIPALLSLSSEELAPLILNSSREDLLQRFKSSLK